MEDNFKTCSDLICNPSRVSPITTLEKLIIDICRVISLETQPLNTLRL